MSLIGASFVLSSQGISVVMPLKIEPASTEKLFEGRIYWEK